MIEAINWITVAEQPPAEKQVVIACLVGPHGERVWPGYLDDGEWHLLVDGYGIEVVPLRATDYWLSLPKHGPGWGAVRFLSYPA
jgi:hypothetical protein